MAHRSRAEMYRLSKEGYCPVCGREKAGHERCSDCGILIGENHWHTEAVGTRCSHCARPNAAPVISDYIRQWARDSDAYRRREA